MSENQEFKIVKIINNETLIINGGTDNNIKVNDVFDIIGVGIEVKDPFTDEVLGFLENIKETLTVIKIFPKMSICAHIAEQSRMESLSNTLTSLYVSGYKKVLNIDENDLLDNENIDKTLRIGDIARKRETTAIQTDLGTIEISTND